MAGDVSKGSGIISSEFAAYDSLLILSSVAKSCQVVQTDTSGRVARVEDMKYWLVAAFVLIFIRRIVERTVLLPLGKRLGIKDHISADKIPCRKSSAFPSLETFHKLKLKSKVEYEPWDKLSKVTGLSCREIERWLKKRERLDKPSPLIKFSESGWRFICYIFSTSIGLLALWDKPWFWDWKTGWIGYPNHDFPFEFQVYYLYGTGLYISFLLTQFVDVKRKDFWEMFFHHIITIALFAATILMNITRAAVVVLLLHDCADIFIESAKMANYAKKESLASGIFILFTLVWIVTRLVIYPWKVIYEVYWKTGFHLLPGHQGYILLSMMIGLFCLHLFWTYFILKIVVNELKPGTKLKDSRSDNESSEEEEDLSSDCYEQEPIGGVAFHENFENAIQKRLSIHCEELANAVMTKQKLIMRRISVEIM